MTGKASDQCEGVEAQVCPLMRVGRGVGFFGNLRGSRRVVMADLGKMLSQGLTSSFW